MRFLSVFLPSLPTDRILRGRDPSAAEAPFALWRKIKGGERIVAANAAARRRGIVPGMAVANSRAIVPALALEEHDAIADASTLAALADWHRRFTPLAALDPPDGVMLDVTGAAALFGGEANLLDEIERRLKAQGFRARTALAPGPALARALARFSDLRLTPMEAAQDDLDAIAAKLPIAALELPDQRAAALGARRAARRRRSFDAAARAARRALWAGDADAARRAHLPRPRSDRAAFRGPRLHRGAALSRRIDAAFRHRGDARDARRRAVPVAGAARRRRAGAGGGVLPRRRRGQACGGGNQPALARSGPHPRAAARTSRGAWRRRPRHGLWLRRSASLRERGGAARRRASLARGRRPRRFEDRRSFRSRRPARRAAGAGPRAAALFAGPASAGIRRGDGAGGLSGARRSRAGAAFAGRRGRCACSSGPSRSTPWRWRPMERRCVFVGAAPCTRPRLSRGRSESPRHGRKRLETRPRAIISTSWTARGAASGSIARAFWGKKARWRAGSCMDCREACDGEVKLLREKGAKRHRPVTFRARKSPNRFDARKTPTK